MIEEHLPVLAYKPGRAYPWQLQEPYRFGTNITGWDANISSAAINEKGLLSIRAGFSYDMGSGPAIDDPAMQVASLAHDAICRLWDVNHHLPYEFRQASDKYFRQVLLNCGVSRFRAWYCYRAVTMWSWWRALKAKRLK